MPISEHQLTEAIHRLGAMLRADGADLIVEDVDVRAARIRVAIDVEGASCADCILPPEQLCETLRFAFEREVGCEFELVIHDPRA